MSATTDASSPWIVEVDEATFRTEVLDRSAQVPVVVDFWAAWCGPCRTLGPMLEAAVTARDGQVVLAKVDVDRNPGLAQTFRVQGIPQVLAFKGGQPVAQFTGAVPAPELERFLDDLVPSEADRAVAAARDLPDEQAEGELRRALELEPDHREAAIALASLLVDRDPDAAVALVAPHRPDPGAEAIVTRASLAGQDEADVEDLQRRVDAGDVDGRTLLDLGRARAARGEYEAAIDQLLAAVEAGGETREPAREQLVALFNVLGDGDPRVTAARPRLARALF